MAGVKHIGAFTRSRLETTMFRGPGACSQTPDAKAALGPEHSNIQQTQQEYQRSIHPWFQRLLHTAAGLRHPNTSVFCSEFGSSVPS